MKIIMMSDILGENDKLAAQNREYLSRRRVMAINMMASPGAGKTSVILKLIDRLRGKVNIGVVEGDIASSIDADTIERLGIPVVQINTGGACHLDAQCTGTGYKSLGLEDGIIFVENVGNLICPRSFDLGESLRVVIASVPEGHDKTFKYITMFEAADIVIINKVDLAEYIGFDFNEFERGLRAVNPGAPVVRVSCRTGKGVDEAAELIIERYNSQFKS